MLTILKLVATKLILPAVLGTAGDLINDFLFPVFSDYGTWEGPPKP